MMFKYGTSVEAAVAFAQDLQSESVEATSADLADGHSERRVVNPIAEQFSTPLPGMPAMRAALTQLGLSEYCAAFEEQGFDDLHWLQQKSRAERQAIARDFLHMGIEQQLRFAEQLPAVQFPRSAMG